MIKRIAFVAIAALVTAYPAAALETGVLGSTMGKVESAAAVSAVEKALNDKVSQMTGMVKCNALRKFYAPADAKRDANNCVGAWDYDINMVSGSNETLTNGKMQATATANEYAAYIVNSATNGSGLRASGAQYGVYGASTNSYGGYFASPNGSGVYGQGAQGVRGDGTNGVYGYATSGWAGYFSGNAAVYGSLYLNGLTTGMLSNFGGMFSMLNGACAAGNATTGACSCPSGRSVYVFLQSTTYEGLPFTIYYCN